MATMQSGREGVPGFDFLQGLMKSAGSALPGMNAWIAPTLDPEELTKRIDELKTVQFWLEQNAKLVASSIQALEVQRMTLSTLKNLNVQVGDLTEAMKIKMPGAAGASGSPGAGAQAPADPPRRRKAGGGKAAAGAPAGTVDPMQWWGALTQQFTELAAKALKDSGADRPPSAAPATATAASEPGTRSAPKPAAKAARTTGQRRKA